ncbi:MAG TPA: amino acid ABC transporter ATP-binding protein [Gemmataceae bacterium]|nr:amino acid ABC transporter ATP-binding protein [Gemmataceae bacterium]
MIQVSGLCKNHGSLAVLKGVCMSVQRGEVAAIIGPSGGGKSTLLRCINGLERFQQGEIQVDNLKLSSRPDGEALRKLRQHVGMVFQQFHLFPHMTVLENVMCGPRLVLKQSRAQAEPEGVRLLERVGLKDKLHCKPEQLSGGQQQRVAIARALAVKPDAILFDEPTSALDPVMANEVLAVITDLAKHEQTMLVVTHAMGFAERVAQTVHVMAEGQVAESGPADQIFHAPRTEVTKRFLMQVKTS